MDTLSYKTLSANKETANKQWLVVDATGVNLGRLGSEVASLLRGTILCELNDLENEYELFVLGTKFENKEDNRSFGFRGDNGIHDCHMNQFNTGKYEEDNGYHQDGCVLLYNKVKKTWKAIFIKFQCQILPNH